MTLTDYLDADRFPATTRDGLTPKEQLTADGIDHGRLQDAVERGAELTPEQLAALAELRVKRPHFVWLSREADRLEQERRRRAAEGRRRILEFLRRKREGRAAQKTVLTVPGTDPG